MAINYALSRTFPLKPEPPQYHLFYDAGAGSIRATVVAYQTETEPEYPSSKNLKNITQVEIKGYGYDRNVGGLVLDNELRKLFVKEFEIKHGKQLSTPIRDNARAMNKLLKEAGKVKEVLSANSESMARVS